MIAWERKKEGVCVCVCVRERGNGKGRERGKRKKKHGVHHANERERGERGLDMRVCV